MTTFQNHADLAVTHILTVPSPATSGTSWTVDSGGGADMPTAPFDVYVFPGNPAEAPTKANAEICICTARTADSFGTVIRAQYGSSARTIMVGDLVVAGITKNHIVTIETAIAAAEAAILTKQPTGNYITALTGDATAAGPGSAAATLATVNANVGSFGTATQVPTLTVNAKGLTTAAANTAIQITESQVTNLVTDLAGKQASGNYITALTSDVTAAGPGSAAATIANNAVSNAKAADMPTHTIKGNNTAGTADPLDLTLAQVKTELNLTGTNSGDVTLTAVGASPNANAATLTAQAFNLQPASASFPGVITSAQFVVLNNTSGTNTGDQTITLTSDVTGTGAGSFATTIANNAVTNAKAADMATQTFKGRTTAGTGDPEDLTIAQSKALLNLTGTNSGDQTITLTGDVTGTGTGSFAATIAALAVTTGKIADDAVTNAKLANMATQTIRGRTTAGTGDPEDLTAAQAKTVLAITATDVAFTPAGDISATNVQAAIAELLSEAFPLGWGAWTPFTPTVTQGVSVANTADFVRYTRVGNTIFYQGRLGITGSGTALSAITVSLPIAYNTGYLFDSPGGDFFLWSASSGYLKSMAVFTGSEFSGLGDGAGAYMGQAGSAMSAGLTSGNMLGWNMQYQVA